MVVRIDRIKQNAGRYVAKAAEESKAVNFISREMQMVPKYLECAKAKAGDLYRFNTKQVDEITSACSTYETRLSITDVVKDLLAIGSEGNCKQLSSEEMVGFLNSTSGMKQFEQKNVLRFLKAAQEDMPAKITPEYLREQNPYEAFRRSCVMLEKNDPETSKRGLGVYDETSIKERYESFIISEYKVLTNPYYASSRSPQKLPFVNYVVNNNKEIVSKIAKCHEPEALYNVFKHAGLNPNVLEASDDLVKLYVMSKGNKYLIRDLGRAFFPEEINAITVALEKEVKQNAASKYYNHVSSSKPSLEYSRSSLMILLDMDDTVRLSPLPRRKISDVYSGGPGRGSNILGGNYERGKKK